MFKWLRDQKFPVVIAFLGFILVIVGYFKISDITKLQLNPYENPLYTVAYLGFFLLISSMLIFLFERFNPIVEPECFKLPEGWNTQPEPLKKSIFLSAPMNVFLVVKRPEDYNINREEILKIISELKRNCDIKDVFYAGENIDKVGNWDLPGVSLKDDFRKIQEREYFILFWPDKFASRSSLVEAGIAMTLNKKCIYLVRNIKDLPFLLQGAHDVHSNAKVIEYKDIDDLLRIIRTNRNKIFDFNSFA